MLPLGGVAVDGTDSCSAVSLSFRSLTSGVVSRGYPLRSRHTFATRLVRGRTDLITVAELLGHARLETTRAYNRPTYVKLPAK
jgi:site-specific recombinase XerD